MNKKTIRDIPEPELKGKRVLVRVDFNVPVDENRHITDDTRIVESLPTIKYLKERGAKVILVSHLGRPEGKFVEELKMDPVARRLEELLGEKVYKVDDCIGEEVEKAISSSKKEKCYLKISASIPRKKPMMRSLPGLWRVWLIFT